MSSRQNKEGGKKKRMCPEKRRRFLETKVTLSKHMPLLRGSYCGDFV